MDREKLIKELKKAGIKDIYENLMVGNINSLSDDEYVKLLSVALVLLNSNDYETQFMGYEIILNYSVAKNDLLPLYEISNSLINTPVIKLIQTLDSKNYIDNLYDEIQNIAIESVKTKNGICYANEQIEITKKFNDKENDSLVVAPTSFGKTELIKQYVLENYNTKNICIVVPTKVLVNQVRYDLIRVFKDVKNRPRIITHYDSIIRADGKNIFVLTQERLFKLVYDRKNIESFDTLLIDEAHNIFSKKDRAILLAKIIILLRLKNPNLIVKYFSPIINSENSLQIKNYIKSIEEIKAKPLIKTDKIFLADFSESMEYYYDEMFDTFEFIANLSRLNKYQYIIKKSKNKNIIYCNTPSKVKKTAEELYNYLPELDDIEIAQIVKDIGEYVDKSYDLIKYIKKGIVYHFGDMPDNIRIYVEDCVKKYKFIKYIICSSTLLEGVNMPFDCMFICEKKIGNANLTYAQLKNLIGRVNRYNEIFNYENIDLSRLISHIYFIRDKMSKDNYKEYIKTNLKYNTLPRITEDKVENPLLEKSSNVIDNNTLQSLVNLSDYGKELSDRQLMMVKTKIGIKMITANIIEIDIVKNEFEIQSRIEKLVGSADSLSLLDTIYNIFFQDIEIISSDKNNIKRLENTQARKFYEYMIRDKMNNKSLKEKVYSMVYYWKNISPTPKSIFVGEKWGLKKRNSNDRIPLYIDITNMSDSEIINYAILRLKEEDNYINYTLLKYIELLKDFGIVSDRDYTLIKYGTDNPANIFFIRDGLSQELTDLLLKKYFKFMHEDNGYYYIDKGIFNVFNDNSILLSELRYYVD